ncbi:MAG: hypothetical protein V8S14_02350 [Lachnospiraceae bacterium]
MERAFPQEKIAQIPPIIEKLGGQEGTLHLENYADGQETITFEKARKIKIKIRKIPQFY